MRFACFDPVMASGMAPLAISLMVGSTRRMAWANRLCLSSNCASGITPNDQSPHISLPMPQNLTPYGSGWPFSRPQAAHRRGGRAVGVLDVIRRRPGIAEAGIDGDIGLYVKQAAHGHEFISADIVRLHRVPRGVDSRRALVRIADRVAPFVSRNKVATGKTVDAGAELLERRDYFS